MKLIHVIDRENINNCKFWFFLSLFLVKKQRFKDIYFELLLSNITSK